MNFFSINGNSVWEIKQASFDRTKQQNETFELEVNGIAIEAHYATEYDVSIKTEMSKAEVIQNLDEIEDLLSNLW